MAKSKQNKTQKKDGNHRAETREERHERLRQQEEARQACFKILPMVGGVLLFFLIVFAVYVRSVPPKVRVPKTSPAPGMDAQRILEQAMKDGNINIDTATAVPAEGEEVPVAEAPAPEGEGEGEAQDSDPNEERVEL